MARSDDNKFINLLLEETFGLIGQNQEERTQDARLAHFEIKKLKSSDNSPFVKDLYQLSDDIFELKKMEEIGTFRLEMELQTIDFPANWGPFEELEKGEKHIDLKQEKLIDVLSSLFPERNTGALLSEDGRYFLVMGRGGDIFDQKIKNLCHDYLALDSKKHLKAS